MPTVPILDTPNVAPQGMPRPWELRSSMPGYMAPTADQIHVQGAPNTAGDAASALGQGAQNAGDQLVNVADQLAQQANTMQAIGAVNQLRQTSQILTNDPQQGYLNLQGAAALNRPDGQSLVQEYGGKMQDAYDQIMGNLSNPMQQRMFAQQAAGVMSQFSNGVQSHVLQEFRNNGLSNLNGSIKLDADAVGQNWNNPDQVQQSVQNTKAAVYQMGQLQGWSADEIAANQTQAVSSLRRTVIETALANQNPTYATSYLQQNKGDMTPNDILAVQGLVNHQLDGHMALTATQAATQQYQGQISPSDSQRLLYLMSGQESNHQDFAADGVTPLTSKSGAMFGMQVMPATAANPGHGIEPAQSQTPAEYNRVGQQLALALVQKYGNVPQALAAYNAGEGNVDKAISDAQAAGQPQNWMTYLANYQSADNHQQTVGYVNGVMSKLLNGGGAAPVPTQAQFVESAINALGPSPRIEQVALTREQATAQYNMLVKSRQEQGQQAVQQAQQALLQNGGNIAQLDPGLRMQVAQYAPDQWPALTNFAGAVANPVKSDNMAAYNQAYSHPQELAQMSDTDFQNFVQTNFTQSTARQLVQYRQDLITGKADTSAQSVNDAAIKQTLDARLQAIGINPSPLRTDTNGMAQMGTIRQYVRDAIFAEQQQSGQKMTPEQIQTKITRMFAQDATFQRNIWGTEIPYGPDGHMPAMAMRAGDIPSDQAAQLKQLLASNGIRNPSDDQLIRAYWSFKNVR